MRQVFYIDINEEITLVIEKLRKAQSEEVFFVIPKHALILQSIISLKLLKKEANNIRKKIAIVTHDKEGKIKAEKAGIFTLSSLEGIKGTQETKQVNIAKKQPRIVGNEKNYLENNRFQIMGSADFYEKTDQKNDEKIKKSEIKQLKTSRLNLFSDFQKSPTDFKENFPQKSFNEFLSNYTKTLENFPAKKPSFSCDNENIVSKKLKKFLIFSTIILILSGMGIAIYLFLPKTEVFISFKRDFFKEIDLRIEGNVQAKEVDYQNKKIPIRIIEKEDLLTLSHFGTGVKSSSRQKARGTILIYNEFSSSPQSLVATTRFRDSENRIFRLVKGVIVPGMTEISGKKQPGVVEAEVIADEPGTQYNINPTSFTIPGFEKSPKFEKFYARSTKPMTGGTDKEGEIARVSQMDIIKAKNKTEMELFKKISEEIKKEIGKEEYLAFQTKEEIVLESFTLTKPEENVKEFSYSVKGKIKVVSFSEKDLEDIVKNNFQQSLDNEQYIISLIQMEYRDIIPQDSIEKVNIDLRAKIFLKPKIDTEAFKKSLLGKNMEQLQEIRKTYPQIEKIDVNFWPDFFSKKVSNYKWRVKIHAD